MVCKMDFPEGGFGQRSFSPCKKTRHETSYHNWWIGIDERENENDSVTTAAMPERDYFQPGLIQCLCIAKDRVANEEMSNHLTKCSLLLSGSEIV